jgi:hypothetical protein
MLSAAHMLPHAPQLATLEVRSTHVPLQAVKPFGQTTFAVWIVNATVLEDAWFPATSVASARTW